MAYTPTTLTINAWSSPLNIDGSDFIKNLDETMNTIITEDAQSLVNFINAEMAKLPPYLANELTLVASEVTTSATNAQLRAWEAEAEKKTADSYANEPAYVNVKEYLSNGDGTFSYTSVSTFSALHYAYDTDAANKVDLVGDTMTGNLEAPSFSIDGDYLSARNRNHLINSNFSEWGYGSPMTPTVPAFFADHWMSTGTNLAGGTVSLSSDTNDMSPHATMTFTSCTGYFELYQRSEGKALYGETITLSFEVYVDNALDIKTGYYQNQGSGLSGHLPNDIINIDTTGEWVKVSDTFTVMDATVTYASTAYVAPLIRIHGNGVDAIGTNTVRVRRAKVEIGSSATPHEEPTKEITVSECRRFRRKYSTQQSTADLAYEMYGTPTETGSSPYIYTSEIAQ